MNTRALQLPTDGLAISILEASPNCILVLNPQGRIMFLNEAGARALELRASRAFDGKAWVKLWPVEFRSQASSAFDEAKQGRRGRFSGMCPSAAGKSIWWDVVVSPVRDQTGEISRVVVIAHDVTQASEAYEEVVLARRNLDAVLSSTNDGIVVVDQNWTITYLNEQAKAQVGQDGRLSLGKNVWEAYPEQRETEFYYNYLRALETQTPAHFEGYLVRLAIWLDVRAFPTGNGLAIFFHDITEAKLARDRIHYLAHHDSLTGLPNRAAFLERLQSSLEESSDNPRPLAVVYVDLDEFKGINDSLGHDAGDAVLIFAAQRLRDGVPSSGLVCRMGGDEFAILLCDDIGFPQVEALVVKLRNSLSQPVSYLNVALSCQASFGIALYPHSDTDSSRLMKNADLALYEAKQSGGRQHAFFSPKVRQAIQQRMSALSCARDALDRDAVLPFYQPKVSFETGGVTGFEALLRWTHPREGVQPPGLIKEAFEDPVLSIELGRRMLDCVIIDMQKWRAKGVDFGSVAINVSASEFVRTDYSATVLERLRSAGLPTSLLEVEVTETVFLDDGTNAVEIALHELHRNGVSIALDDFGTGYASLAHLNKFPVSWLKIDQSFVRGLGRNPDASAIVKAVMGLSKGLGIDVVAEGVETLEQWKILKKAGCTLAQGYLISKPMSEGRVPHFLENWLGVPDEHNLRVINGGP